MSKSKKTIGTIRLFVGWQEDPKQFIIQQGPDKFDNFVQAVAKTKETTSLIGLLFIALTDRLPFKKNSKEINF